MDLSLEDDEDRYELRITADDVREALLLDARRFMQLGLVGEVVFWLALIVVAVGGPVGLLAMGAYAGAAVAIAWGVIQVGKASDMRPAQQGLFLLLALAPIVRLIPVAAFIGRSSSVLSAEAARQRAQTREAQRAEKSRSRSKPETAKRKKPADEVEVFDGLEGVHRVDTLAAARTQPVAPANSPATPAASAVQWPANDVVRQQALARLSTALPRIRLIDTEGLADGMLMPPELVMRDLNIPLDGDPSLLDLPVTRATKGAFGVQYMVEDGKRFNTVLASDLADAGLTVDALHRLALVNLRRLVKGELRLKRANSKDAGYRAMRIKLDGSHESSVLLLDDLWDKTLKKHTPNGVVAVMPSRDVCTFIDLSALTKGGLADLREAMLYAKRLNGEAVNAILHRQGRHWALAGELDGV
ncbi:hypothetical protein J2W49_004078 [Hydrogenophaga palleronii]|uniref:Uncharacterized protein n=1 Tax=Hydrogenophaga palleronii TaxID=65655 RepID=A0ABU1WT74_9BURK|nr:hypothetical protein [Hydrogenophaga palleronii]MDR7152102.1 hypothetical protein [Hydrogenophaga palleronii]